MMFWSERNKILFWLIHNHLINKISSINDAFRYIREKKLSSYASRLSSFWYLDNVIKITGPRVESEVAGFVVFSHIRMMGYFRLGYSRVEVCPTGLDVPAGSRNTRKATSDSSHDPYFQLFFAPLNSFIFSSEATR